MNIEEILFAKSGQGDYFANALQQEICATQRFLGTKNC
jgi:hypothetical protein